MIVPWSARVLPEHVVFCWPATQAPARVMSMLSGCCVLLSLPPLTRPAFGTPLSAGLLLLTGRLSTCWLQGVRPIRSAHGDRPLRSVWRSVFCQKTHTDGRASRPPLSHRVWHGFRCLRGLIVTGHGITGGTCFDLSDTLVDVVFSPGWMLLTRVSGWVSTGLHAHARGLQLENCTDVRAGA
jgi:hypothetical protein